MWVKWAAKTESTDLGWEEGKKKNTVDILDLTRNSRLCSSIFTNEMWLLELPSLPGITGWNHQGRNDGKKDMYLQSSVVLREPVSSGATFDLISFKGKVQRFWRRFQHVSRFLLLTCPLHSHQMEVIGTVCVLQRAAHTHSDDDISIIRTLEDRHAFGPSKVKFLLKVLAL